jgi:threonine aldolase
VGSALCGSREFIARAHRLRKITGGGLRQAGLLAAAALHALDHHIDRLADDHRLARRLAAGLAALPGWDVSPPQTNIVFARLAGDDGARSAALLAHLRAHGVLATGLVGLRMVTHLDVDAEGIDRAIAAAAAFALS